MPPREILADDTIYIRARALDVGSDYVQAIVDDGVSFSVTIWIPSRECARLEDLADLPPIRHANPRHVER